MDINTPTCILCMPGRRIILSTACPRPNILKLLLLLLLIMDL